jgi:hypothetical protein
VADQDEEDEDEEFRTTEGHPGESAAQPAARNAVRHLPRVVGGVRARLRAAPGG